MTTATTSNPFPGTEAVFHDEQNMETVTPWSHQQRLMEECLRLHDEGVRRICMSSATGSGKSLVMAMLVKHFLDQEKRVSLYTNRRLLLDQSAKNFLGFDIEHGVRAAGHTDLRWMPFQISSIQTEVVRLASPEKYKGWTLHDADFVLLDEAHCNSGPEIRKILAQHVAAGATVCGVTATPIDLGQLYDRLVLGCTMQEGRDCGALVSAEVFGPDEPDMRALKKLPGLGEDLSENQARKVMMNPTIFGRVWEWWQRLNPQRKSTVGFAPGRGESLQFAQEFYRQGVKAAHIDSDYAWVNGEMYERDEDARRQILEDYEKGLITVLWNRFVLREGIDLKRTEHIILATVFGAVQPYLQALGRGMRGSPATGKTKLRVQDHGGNFWRHGSPNVDREWRLEYTSAIISGLREEFLRSHPEKIPVRCPQCAQIIAGRECPCGFVPKNKLYPRHVVQIDGTLKMLGQVPWKARAIDTRPGAEANWIKMYWQAMKSEKWNPTFREAMGYYQAKNQWLYPSKDWKFMPIEPVDSFRAVKSVPQERLRR